MHSPGPHDRPRPDQPGRMTGLPVARLIGHSLRGAIGTVHPRGLFDLAAPRDCDADGAQHFARRAAA